MNRKLLTYLLLLLVVGIGVFLALSMLDSGKSDASQNKEYTQSSAVKNGLSNPDAQRAEISSPMDNGIAVKGKPPKIGVGNARDEAGLPPAMANRPPVSDLPEGVAGPGRGLDPSGTKQSEGGAKLDMPPGVADGPPIPRSMVAQIDSFVQESKRTAGPEAVELGERLFASTNALLQVAGLAVLSENGALTSEQLQKVASDDDLALAVNALGWLREHGNTEHSAELSNMLGERGIDNDQIISLLSSADLNSSGSRVALDIVAEQMHPDDARELYQAVSEDDMQSYSMRMKSALLLRDKMQFEEYRNEVNRLASQAGDEDPLWQEGVSRLSENLKGPAEVVGGTPTLTGNDIDELLAREYPMMLEDLAQNLEYVTSREDAYISTEAAETLNQRLQELQNRPWDANQKVRLERIKSIAKILPDLADPPEKEPANLVTPPQ